MNYYFTYCPICDTVYVVPKDERNNVYTHCLKCGHRCSIGTLRELSKSWLSETYTMEDYMEAVEDTMEVVNQFLKHHTDLYNANTPEISDKEWDKYYFFLQKLEAEAGHPAKDSVTQKIHYTAVTGLKKVKHNHPMLSLDKTKNWDRFVKYFDDYKDVVLMLKLDGLTCSLRYVDGRLVSAETRGDGEVGEDILHNALVIPSIPKRIDVMGEVIIDGEIICTYKNFQPFADKFKNQRNFASGSITLYDSKECEKRNLTFIPWYVPTGLGNSMAENFNKLGELGFTVAPWTATMEWDARDFLKDKAKELGYPIDGLVGRYDDISYGESLGRTIHHMRAGYAFKFEDEEYETKLRKIVYEPSRNGQLTPVAIFDPVDTGDSVIERATLHNLNIMETVLKNPQKGQTIRVIKANDIIPMIVSAEYSEGNPLEDAIVETCPMCGGKTEVRTSENGIKTLWCTNPECEGKLINRLEHMYGKGKIEIRGLSKATFDKFIERGWIKNCRDVYEVLPGKRAELERTTGFGVKSVNNLIESIEKSKHCLLEQVICAAGIPLIGKTASRALAKHFGSWDRFRTAVKNGNSFCDIDGFGLEMSRAIKEFNYEEIDYIVDNFLQITTEELQEEKNGTDVLNGKTICITGKLKLYKNRDELKSVIESAGGRVVGSMSSKVDYLINNDVNSTSSKNKSAKAAGIPIINEEEFQKLLEIV